MREAFFAQAAEQLDQLRQRDPEAWEAYRAESRIWQAGTERDWSIRDEDEDEDWWGDCNR